MKWNGRIQRSAILFYCVLLTGSLFFSCSGEEEKKNIFPEMGGLDTIEQVVDQLIINIEADTVINSFFTGVFSEEYRKLSFRNHLIDQFCEISGGPCVYKGKTMKMAHEGMNITEEELMAFVQDLTAAMNQYSIASAVQDDFLARLATLYADIAGQ